MADDLIALAPVVTNIPWNLNLVLELRVGHWQIRDLLQRQNARPNWQIQILLIILRWPGSYLRRCALDRYDNNRRLLQLNRARWPHIAPSAGDQALGECLERLHARVVVQDRVALAEDDHRAIVHRVAKRRACQNNSIQQCDCDTDIATGFDMPQQTAAFRAVQ